MAAIGFVGNIPIITSFKPGASLGSKV